MSEDIGSGGGKMEKLCPVCRSPMKCTQDYLEYALAEDIQECAACGYYYEFVTGNSVERIDGVEFFHYWDESIAADYATQKERDRAMEVTKRKFERSGHDS